MGINDLFSGDVAILQGSVLKSSDEHITLQLFPGLNVDVERCHCSSVDEATDPVSGRTFVRICLNPDAELRAVFQPRLARLAMNETGGVPFTAGGLPEGVRQGPTFLARQAPGGPGGGGGWRPIGTATAGEFRTRSRSVWGWSNDDTTYSDEQTDQTTAFA